MDKKTDSMSSGTSQTPDLSLAIPCYNEEGSLRSTVLQLANSFREKGIDLELVLVDNGSEDQTGKIIDELIDEGMPVVKGIVEHNKGYGYGVLCGLRLCRGKFVGFICADNQVDSGDVVKLYEIAAQTKTPKLLKVRRRFRMDGFKRKVTSVAFNLIANILFGGLGSIDVNGNPKILPKDYLERMELNSEDWFLDAEVIIKAKRMGLGIYEMNVWARMRHEGSSNVRVSTCWEFIKNLLKYRMTFFPDKPRAHNVWEI